MWGLGLRFWRSFRTWGRPFQIAALTALIVLVLAVVAVFFGPLDLRVPALVSVFGSVIAFQLLVMWSLRGMQTAQSLAWGAFRRGEFEECIRILEKERADGKTNRSQLHLLAIAHKQLGRLSESEALARELIAEDAEKPTAWRILGQVLMIEGRWEEAAPALERASHTHADSQVELGLLQYIRREREAAAIEIRDALDKKQCTASHDWLARIILGDVPHLNDDAGDYWKDEAARFSQTEYGAALVKLISERIPDEPAP